jgi:hypothetical protein
MMGTAININRGFISIATLVEGLIAVKNNAMDLVGNSTVRQVNLAIQVRCITTSSFQTELVFVTNERAKQRRTS